MSDNFSPEEHKFAESKYFEELEIGEKFYIPSRTLTDANFAAFQMASGDNHPIHYDVEYCRARGHANLLAHGPFPGPAEQRLKNALILQTFSTTGRSTGRS